MPATGNVVVRDFQPPLVTVAWLDEEVLDAVDVWLFAERAETVASGNCEMSITRPEGMNGRGSETRVVSLTIMPRMRGGSVVAAVEREADEEKAAEAAGGKMRIGPSRSTTTVEGTNGAAVSWLAKATSTSRKSTTWEFDCSGRVGSQLFSFAIGPIAGSSMLDHRLDVEERKPVPTGADVGAIEEGAVAGGAAGGVV